MIGTELDHFSITAKLGEGGMGEVYRATDGKLGREVAVKVLPEAFVADGERLARFEREARLLASLSHPRIAGIHEIGSARAGEREVHYLVMELVAGETLAERMARGPLPLEEVVAIAGQIAEALEAAHERGVVHRDLKPGNVMLGPDGGVKVLDFGLAKALAPESADPDSGGISLSPTLTAQMTGLDVLLGTAGYMSPEQARGRPVDRRADIWAFGVLVYEMLRGEPLFVGETVSDTLAGVLKEEPSWRDLPGDLPARLRWLLERCLDKDPTTRLRDIGEARVLLAGDLQGPLPGEGEEREANSGKRSGDWAWTAAALVVGLLLGGGIGGLAFRSTSPAAEAPPVRRYEIPIPGLLSFFGNHPVVSPDGEALAYTAEKALWVRRLDESEPRRLLALADDLWGLGWSHDGRSLAYSSDGTLWRLAVEGGDPVPVTAIPDRGRAVSTLWASDGTITFSVWRGALYRVAARGGDPRLLLELDEKTEIDIHDLESLPDGSLVFSIHTTGGGNSLDVLRNGERRTLLEIEGQELLAPRFSPTGHLVFVRRGTTEGIWAVELSPETWMPSGEPFLAHPNAGGFVLSAQGTLFYSVTAGAREILAWVDETGAVVETVGEAEEELQDGHVSPDGLRVAVSIEAGDESDIWVIDLERGTRTQLDFPGGSEDDGVWLDNETILAERSADDAIYRMRADGGGNPTPVLDEGSYPMPTPDGRWILFHIMRGQERQLWRAPADDSLEPERILRLDTSYYDARVSPSGSWLAYAEGDGDDYQVFLTRWPSLEGRWQVSREGGSRIRWDPEGGRLFYSDGDVIRQVSVAGTERPLLGQPEVVFAESGRLHLWESFDVASGPEGLRFLLIQDAEVEGEGPLGALPRIAVIQSWTTELERELGR